MFKTCPACKESKPHGDFNKSIARADGLQTECRICKASRDKKYHEKNRDKIIERKSRPENRLNRKAKQYGISSQELSDLIISSSGLCQICKEKPGTHIDHCHETNKVRGILCTQCNVGLGMFRDNPKFLQSAGNYLVLATI